MNRSLFLSAIFFFGMVGLAVAVPVQEDSSDEKEGVTIKGTVVQASKLESFQIDLTQLKIRFLKRVELPPAPVPENWSKMKQADRESWWKSFMETDEGKAYQENRQKLLESADEYEGNVDVDGNFVVYDVSPGIYAMAGRFDKEIGPRSYAFEIFGEIPVSEEADLIELGKKPLVVTPIIRTGEPASGWRTVRSLGGSEVSLESFRGKYLLVNFWASDDPSKEFQKDVQTAYQKLKSNHPFELLSVSLDQEAANWKAFVQEQKLGGVHVHAARNDRIVRVFGVHATPALLLIDPKGVIKMTYQEMKNAFRAGKPTLDLIIDDRINGKDVPTPAKANGTEEKSPVKDQ